MADRVLRRSPDMTIHQTAVLQNLSLYPSIFSCKLQGCRAFHPAGLGSAPSVLLCLSGVRSTYSAGRPTTTHAIGQGLKGAGVEPAARNVGVGRRPVLCLPPCVNSRPGAQSVRSVFAEGFPRGTRRRPVSLDSRVTVHAAPSCFERSLGCRAAGARPPSRTPTILLSTSLCLTIYHKLLVLSRAK
jgi:hypothetical protein